MKYLAALFLIAGSLSLSAQSENPEINKRNFAGKKVGHWIEYVASDSSVKVESYYVQGVQHGTFKTFKNDKLTSFGFMDYGKYHGEVTTYGPSGKPSIVTKYKKGKMLEQKFLNPNAKASGTVEIIDGKEYIWKVGELIEKNTDNNQKSESSLIREI